MLRQLSAVPHLRPQECHNEQVRDDNKPHPGQWRIMQVDSGTAGIIVAVGFTLLGLALAPFFLLGAIPVGVAVALLLRYTDKNR
jgi:hypothetical protein